MAKRSLKIAEQYLKKAENAFITFGLTQNALAQRLNLSRSTVSNFLRGKPIYKENFVTICEILKLDWQEITGLKTTQSTQGRMGIAHLTESSNNIEELVTQLRQLLKADIEACCGKMRIFDMSQEIELGKIYTSVNILEKITSYRRKEIKELPKIGNTDSDRFNLGAITEERILGKEAVDRHKKLLIFGKPGAGKTTFLKHLAIQCNRNQFRGDLVPFFVTLKKFAEDENKQGLLAYLNPPKSLIGEINNALKQVLENGKALILLDGLDEVLKDDTKRVIREIETLSNSYPKNQFLMTCRIAAKEYTFTNFTEVEIADFNDEQIATFAHNWFKDKPVKPEAFLKRLKKDKPIKELVSNPLLLTLLCITVDNKSGKFPTNRRELYKDGIRELLKKWDISQGVERDIIYRPLSIAKKEDLLSKIAWETFTPGDYFFKQDKAERLISEYIRNLPSANLDDEALQGDSEIVLKNIEAQHGLLVARAKYIYSFSHLTFQEYFTAREIITVRQSNDEALQELVSHLFEPRWREVFLLAVAMSPNAERLVLLMKQHIDNLLAEDTKIQNFLRWLYQKTQTVNIKFETENAIKIKQMHKLYVDSNFSLSRNLYFCFVTDVEFNPNYHLYLWNNNVYSKLNIDFDLYDCFEFYSRYEYKFPEGSPPECFLDDMFAKTKAGYYELNKELKEIQNQLSNKSKILFGQWWSENQEIWLSKFRAIMITHRNIGHDWQFNKTQKDKLEQYYRANQLLTQCLHQDCYVSPEVRQYIEETLLLPIAEIKTFEVQRRKFKR